MSLSNLVAGNPANTTSPRPGFRTLIAYREEDLPVSKEHKGPFGTVSSFRSLNCIQFLARYSAIGRS
jgi:hypothetical protein